MDIDSLWVDFDCPSCGYADEVQILELRLESEVWCHNCKKKIKLRDSNASVDSSVKEISKTINDIEKMFKKFK